MFFFFFKLTHVNAYPLPNLICKLFVNLITFRVEQNCYDYFGNQFEWYLFWKKCHYLSILKP